MKKKTTRMSAYAKTLGEALQEFNLKKFKTWVQKRRPLLWRTFKYFDEEVQMGTMCKMITNRNDLLNTEACKKASKWLAEHNMKGRIF